MINYTDCRCWLVQTKTRHLKLHALDGRICLTRHTPLAASDASFISDTLLPHMVPVADASAGGSGSDRCAPFPPAAAATATTRRFLRQQQLLMLLMLLLLTSGRLYRLLAWMVLLVALGEG